MTATQNGARTAEQPVAEETGSTLSAGELAHAALRGTIAAAAMTGTRTLTQDLGLVTESPPQQILRRRAKGLMKHVPRRRRRTVLELFHWSYGAAGGVGYGMLPDVVRRQPWSGPLYGIGIWLKFELLIAPALGLPHARNARPVERVTLLADHLLYGLVLSETRRRPQE
jgi:uncharacterized membrane protein YagU involved in acid resistance